MLHIRNLRGILLALGTTVSGCMAPSGATPEEPDVRESALDQAGKLDGQSLAASAPIAENASFEEPLAVLFAPDDPVTTTEVALIDRIRAARTADPQDYTEGQNPYRIRYAVYNLRNPVVYTALADAHDAGVDVQILIDAHQLDPERTWNVADEYLVDSRGFEFVSNHRQLTSQTHASADLIGIKSSGLMHLKARIFESPEWSAVLSGSMNPGDNAVMNEETLHLIRDPALIARYDSAYTAIRRGQNIDNRWSDSAAVNVLFTPAASGPRAGGQLLRWLEEEEELILLMVFSLRDITGEGSSNSLIDTLGSKAQSGVPVYVMTDRKQSDGVDAHGTPLYRDDPTEDHLREAGVHVFEATNLTTDFTAMHHKVGILGLTNVRIVTDAANWTFSGLGSATQRARNYESQLFVDSGKLDGNRTGRRYLAQWLRVLGRYAHQSASDGEPSAAEVRDRLLAMSGWPAQPVRFQVAAETNWGESIGIRGNLPELGDWGREHDGVSLGTAADSYPIWSQNEPTLLPVGIEFEWKAVASFSEGSTRWESGDNRSSFSSPLPLIADPDLILEAQWRD